MNKSELVEQVAVTAALSKADAARVLQAFEKIVTYQLANGGEVALTGFGTFTVTDKPERTGRNPKTGEPLTIAAHKSPKFKPGKLLKEAVNK